jgi:tRNA(adenine34) deaminase
MPDSLLPNDPPAHDSSGDIVREDRRLMALALAQAQAAAAEDEVPVGAIIIRGGQVLAAAHNQREQLRDPTAHAEMIAITQAATALDSWRLEGCTLYVTLEPCPMCAGAIVQSRVKRVVYGADDPKAGAVKSLYRLLEDSRLNHRAEVTGGVMSQECGEVLSQYFQQKRLAKSSPAS